MTDVKPEPEDPGSASEQTQGAVRGDLVPSDADRVEGLRPAMLEEFQEALPLQRSIRRLAGVVGRALDRELRDCEDRARRLGEDLSNERIAHARTDERLKTV